MNPWLATAAYLLAGLTISYICDNYVEMSDEPGGYAFIVLIIVLWPIFAVVLAIAGLYHLFAATIDAFRR